MSFFVRKFLPEQKIWISTLPPAIAKGVFLILSWFFFSLTTNLYSQKIPDLIFVQIPASVHSAADVEQKLRTPVDRYAAGARIVKLQSSSANSVNLTPEFYAACDPDVSFDGNTIIFTGKKNADDFWQIWQMNTDGSEKVQITNRPGNCITPLFAGHRFYLDDPQPTPQIIYAGSEHGWVNFQEPEQVFSLYGTDPAGKSCYRLTFNLHSDYSPDVLPNGQIVFISWQKNDSVESPAGHFALLAVNNDGTDFMPYYGNHEKPVYKDMVAISDYDDRIYFVESDSMTWLGGGDIAFISQRRPLHSYQKLTRTAKGLFHSPCPLPEGRLLASYRSGSSKTVFSIIRIDAQSGLPGKQVFSEPGWHSIDTQVLSEHPAARGHSNWLIPGTRHGVFYCLNSTLTNYPEFQNEAKGAIKYLRVVEGIPRSKSEGSSEFPSRPILENESKYDPRNLYDQKRILGVVPVEQDGSFNIKVPAETPLSFQLLDENYLALRSQQTWSWVIGNENRGCIGCHEDPELSPPNILVKAVTRPSIDLTIPVEQRRMVDFRQNIAPLLESNCSTNHCHGAEQAKLNLHTLSADSSDETVFQIYKRLLDPVPERFRQGYVVPGKAKESPLIWFLSGKSLGADQTVSNSGLSEMPPDHTLPVEERLIFIEWIDLGAAWDLRTSISSKMVQ